MPLDNSLKISLLISIILHAVIFLPLSFHLKKPFAKQISPELKIVYLTTKKIHSVKALPAKKKAVQVVKTKGEMRTDSSMGLPSPTVQPIEKRKKNKSTDRIISTPKSVTQEENIEIPPELPQEKKQLYLSYYQSIREEIRLFVVNNYPRFIACGEVCLYFVLTSNGNLKEIKVVEERSSRNHILKEIVKRSIQQASPFAPFPQGLNQPQLSFNVIVSFELEHGN